jgi:hypothetical protein
MTTEIADNSQKATTKSKQGKNLNPPTPINLYCSPISMSFKKIPNSSGLNSDVYICTSQCQFSHAFTTNVTND